MTSNYESISQAINNVIDVNHLFSQAFQLHQQGQVNEAAKLYQTIVDIEPNHSDALHLLGLILNDNQDIDTACKLITLAIKSNAKVAQYHYNLARIYQDIGKLDKAIKGYVKATRLKPDYLEAFENLGVAYQDSDNIPAAKRAYSRAINIDTTSVIALLNMGTLLMEMGNHNEAISFLDKIISRDPTSAEAHSKKAQILLSNGKFFEGWQEYPWMYLCDEFIECNPVRVIPFPKWNGSSLKEKNILINSDQGIGDEIMFASCIQDVVAQAKSVTVECDSRLIEIFHRSFPQINLISRDKDRNFFWDKNYGSFDCRITMSELPRYYRNTETAFPKRKNFLTVDGKRKQYWRHIIQQLPGKINVGISWSGGSSERAIIARSFPLNLWEKYFHTQNVNFINLQYGDHKNAVVHFNNNSKVHLNCFSQLDPLTNSDDFCALISNLDLVISVDNSTVHFAGAVGTPVWALLPFNSEWRWLRDREDSIWYSSVSLFRADKPGIYGKNKLLQRIASKLVKYQKPDFGNVINLMQASEKGENKITGKILRKNAKRDYALIINDTSSWYHWGCSCTSLAIHDQLRQHWDAVASVPIFDTNKLNFLPNSINQFDSQELFDKFETAYPDIIKNIQHAAVIYINGEGTLHQVSQSALGLLYIIYIAKVRLNRKIYIINHSCYPDNDQSDILSEASILYKKVYDEVDFIAIREAISLDRLTNIGLRPSISFDCLPLFIEKYYDKPISTDNKSIIIAGSVSWSIHVMRQIEALIKQLYSIGLKPTLLIGANAYPASDDLRFIEALHQHVGKSCELVYASSELEWLSVIDQAALLISGRFHHTIAAAFLQTPFIVMESNTKKIAGLLQMLEISSCISNNEAKLCEVLFELATSLLKDPSSAIITENVKNRLLNLAKNNFSKLECSI